DVFGTRGRDRRDQPDIRGPETSLHAVAARGGAADRRAARHRQLQARGRAAEPGQFAARLPLCAALPARRRALPRRRSAKPRAAGLRGRSRTDFVREAAVRAAEDVLMENRLIRMSADGFTEFMAILSAPAAVVPEMVELAKRAAPWEPGYVAKS